MMFFWDDTLVIKLTATQCIYVPCACLDLKLFLTFQHLNLKACRLSLSRWILVTSMFDPSIL
jgi:hypothetical protein